MLGYVQQYQALHGLKPDGIIGPLTIGFMIENLKIRREHIPHFLGQCAHESANFTAGRENMNYSEQALKRVFRRHFLEHEFLLYARNPKAIANRVYANRMGNGAELTGDGWKYRGVGPPQLTGKNNIQAYFKYARLPVDSDPNIILKPEHYFNSAKFFFDENNLWRLIPDVLRLSKAINVGSPDSSVLPHGLQDRIGKTLIFSSTATA